MCGTSDCEPSPASILGRRSFLAAAVGAPALALVVPAHAAAARHPASVSAPARVAMPEMRRRSDWAPDLPVRSPIEAETVEFLLVHHTSEPGTDYQPEEVERLLRQIYNFHTGAEKNWPDIAYNFFVDKFGTIWEGRTGSADGPLQGSATGGNQGFSQLCCFLGDFESEPPPAPAVESMIALLAWLADRYEVDMTPGATATFASRGSNLWPAGVEVTTETISTHRQMSQTSCPGTACHELVTGQFQKLVSARLPAVAPTTAGSTDSTSSTISTTTAPPAAETSPTTTSPQSKPAEQAARDRVLDVPQPGGNSKWPIGLGAAASAALAGGALAFGLRSRSRSEAGALAYAVAVDTVPTAAPAPVGTGPADDAASFVPLTTCSPVLWWPATSPQGSAGTAALNTLEVFWLSGPEYSADARRHIESSLHASIEKLGNNADVSLGPWFTQMLSAILPSVAHPADSALVLGATTSRECLALSTGNARVKVPGVTGTHRPRPSLPGIDRRSGMAHRWAVPASGAWLIGWIGGPAELSVDPDVVAADIEQAPERVAEHLGTTKGYLGVPLGSTT